MKTAVVLGHVLVPISLLGAGYVINRFHLWDDVGNLTMPWLCTAIAVAVLLQGVVCLALQVSPTEIPRRAAAMVVVAAVVIFGIGMIVDRISYGSADIWLAGVGTWVGFAVVLAGVFALPYVG